MSTTDELLEEMLEDAEEYATPVTDDDLQFWIDEHLRVISIPKNGVVAGVEGDKNVNKIKFGMNRYYHGFDMSTFSGRILYSNAKGNKNYYNITDMQASGSAITFSWLVDADAVQYMGKTAFVVYLFKTQGSELRQKFYSTLATLKVLEGMEVDSAVPVEKQTDIIERMKEEISAYAEEVKKSLPADYTAMTEQVSSLKEDIVNNETVILNEFVATYKTVAGQSHSSTKDRKDFSVPNGALIRITAESTEKLDYQLFGVKSDGNTDPLIGFNGSESYCYAKSDYVALGLNNIAPKENGIVKWHVWLDDSVTYRGNKINKIYKDIPLFANGNSYSNTLLKFNFGGLNDDGSVSDISYRIVSNLYLADRDYTFYIASGRRFGVSIYSESGVFVSNSGWMTDSFTIKKGEAFRIVISSTSSTTQEEKKHIPIIEEDSKFLTYSSKSFDFAKTNFSKEEIISKNWIQGTVSNGLLDWHNTECISRPEFIYCGGCKKLKLYQKNKDGSFWKIRCTFFDENRKMLSFEGYVQKDTFDIPEKAEFVRISISLYVDNKVTTTTPNSYDENRYITLTLIANKTYEKINSMFSDKLCKIPADATFGTYSGKKIEIAQNTIAYYKYMAIETSVFGEQSIQGSCVYGNTLFVTCNTMSKIVMYDLVLKNKIDEIVLSPVSTYHCNTINFGKQKYSESDAYPLLYVSMENIAEHKLIVLHITDSDGTYNAEVVQTITYPNPTESLQYYPNATVDNENQYIYVIGYIKDSYLEDNSNALRIRVWKLPSLSDGNVTLEIANSLKTFEIPALNCTQGALVHNGNILQCYGAQWAGDGSIYLGMISPGEQNMVTKIKMSDIGYTTEPESVFIWNGGLYIINALGEIHRIYL